MVKYNGINHLAMATGDMDKTIRFWRDLLGMRLVAGLGRPGSRHYFFQINERDLIAFFEWPQVKPMPEKEHGYPVEGPFIFDHVAIGVEKKLDLLELYDRLNAAGFWVSEIIDHGFIHSLYSFDPNGIPIEFCWNVPEVNIRQNPSMVDKEPSEIAKQGPEPQPGHWPAAHQPTPADDYMAYPGEGMALIDPEVKQTW